MKKPVVGVVFGSTSTEHDISITTAITAIIKPLELTGKYEVVPIYIARDGRWYSDKQLGDITLYNSGKIDEWLAKREPLIVSIGGGLRLLPTALFAPKHRVDVIFPALHGQYGEAAGLFEMAGVPYVGCDVASSTVAMDGVLTRQVVQANGIPTVAYEHFYKHEFEDDPDEWITRINRHLHYPLFVRPAHLGLDSGTTQVADPADLQQAIELVLQSDNRVLVEEGVKNLEEVMLPVMGNKSPRPALIEKVQDSTLPATLPKNLYQKAEATGMAIFRAVGCTGMACVHMMIDTKTGVVYCNKVNPMPGSLCQHNWNRAGTSNVDLVEELIRLALERHAQKAKLETTSSTSLIKQS